MSEPQKGEERFWIRQRELAEEYLLLSPIDLEGARRTGSCLGTADEYLWGALRLVLTGLEAKGHAYFEAASDLAARAYEANERWIYDDPDGANRFGRYAALRLAAIAGWAAGREGHSQWLSEAVGLLNEEIRLAEDQGPAVTPDVRGHLALHLGQLGRWKELAASDMRVGNATERVGKFWYRFGTILKKIGEAWAAEDASDNRRRARRALDEWLLARTDVGKYGRLFDPMLSTGDLLGAVQVRAMWLDRDTDALGAIRALRRPTPGG